MPTPLENEVWSALKSDGTMMLELDGGNCAPMRFYAEKAEVWLDAPSHLADVRTLFGADRKMTWGTKSAESISADRHLSDRRAPWRKKPSPASRRRGSTTLTADQKAEAKRRARRAGRRYPNLVDNMNVARKARKGSSDGRKP